MARWIAGEAKSFHMGGRTCVALAQQCMYKMARRSQKIRVRCWQIEVLLVDQVLGSPLCIICGSKKLISCHESHHAPVYAMELPASFQPAPWSDVMVQSPVVSRRLCCEKPVHRFGFSQLLSCYT